MGAILPRVASPRVQVPLATTACLVAIAQALMHLLDIRLLSPSATVVGLLLAAPMAYAVSVSLFVLSKNARQAYLWAAFGPIAISTVVGDIVVAWMLDERPSVALSALGVLIPSFPEGLVPVTIAAALVGVPASCVLAVEVWAAKGAREVDPVRGAHHFTAMAWVVALSMTSLPLAMGDDEERALAGALALLAVVQLGIQALDARRLRAENTLHVGPYRSMPAQRS
jgi:hypothetical protein